MLKIWHMYAPPSRIVSLDEVQPAPTCQKHPETFNSISTVSKRSQNSRVIIQTPKVKGESRSWRSALILPCYFGHILNFILFLYHGWTSILNPLNQHFEYSCVMPWQNCRSLLAPQIFGHFRGPGTVISIDFHLSQTFNRWLLWNVCRLFFDVFLSIFWSQHFAVQLRAIGLHPGVSGIWVESWRPLAPSPGKSWARWPSPKPVPWRSWNDSSQWHITGRERCLGLLGGQHVEEVEADRDTIYQYYTWICIYII